MKTRRIIIVLAALLLVVVCFYAIKEGESVFNATSGMLVLIIINFSLKESKNKVIARSAPSPRQTLEIQPFRKEFIASFEQIGLFLLSVGVIVFGLAMASRLISVAIVFFILGIVYLIFAIKSPKLILSDDGLEFVMLFRELKFKWTDILEIVSYHDGTDYLMMSEGNQKIPLTVFDLKWRKREIGRIIRKNAPFLEYLD